MTSGTGHRAYIGIGSNLNGPARQIESATEALDELPDTQVMARSSLYRSAPFGGIEQPDFVNAAALLHTQLSPRSLLQGLQQIETAHGRDRDEVRWGPRVLDLDLLVFGDAIIDEPGLSVPHPGITERNFVLLPLREIDPELVIPGLGPLAAIPVNELEPHISLIASEIA